MTAGTPTSVSHEGRDDGSSGWADGSGGRVGTGLESVRGRLLRIVDSRAVMATSDERPPGQGPAWPATGMYGTSDRAQLALRSWIRAGAGMSGEDLDALTGSDEVVVGADQAGAVRTA